MRLLSTIAAVTFGVSAVSTTPSASAQQWPSRIVKIIVPGGPGGGFDITARVLSDRLGAELGQGVVVENKPGAGTLVGTDLVAKAPADGYTLLLGGLSNIALNPGLYKKLPYDPIADFTVIGLAVEWAFVLLSRRDLPAETLTDLVVYARSHPDALTYGSAGNGTGQHIAMAVTAHMAGIKMRHVPYRGSMGAYQDILGGRVDLIFDNASTALSQLQGGQFRALAVSSPKRQPALPDVPSVMGAGVGPLDMETWFGLFVRAGTDRAIVARLRAALGKALTDPRVRDTFERTGGVMFDLSVADTQALVRRDVERWSRLLGEVGITAD